MMVEFKARLDAWSESNPGDAAFAAESVQSDFSELVAIFERQLEEITDGENPARSHLLEAKAAAERGLELTRNLIAILQTRD